MEILSETKLGNPYKQPLCLWLDIGSFLKQRKNYLGKKQISGISTVVHLLSSSLGAPSRMKSVAFLVLTLLDIFTTCLPCSIPLLTKVSWIGGNRALPLRVATYFSSGYGLNWTIPWSTSFCSVLSKASLSSNRNPHSHRYSCNKFIEAFSCLVSPQSMTTST